MDSQFPSSKSSSTWGATPVRSASATPMATPKVGAQFGATPARSVSSIGGQTPRDIKNAKLSAEFESKNRYLSDAELDSLLPQHGYFIVPPPESYAPIRTPSRKVTETPTPFAG